MIFILFSEKVAIFICCEETGAVGEEVGGCRHCRSGCFQHTVVFTHTHTHTQFHFLPFLFHLLDKSISALCDYSMTCVPSALKQGFAPCHQSDFDSLHTDTQGRVFSLLPLQLLPLPAEVWGAPSLSHYPPSCLHAQGCLNPSGMPIAAFPQLSAPKIVNFLIHQLP